MALDFWRRLWGELDLRRAVKIERRPGGETRIAVEDRIPHLRARREGRLRYRVTTTRIKLSSAGFPDNELRGRIGAAAAKARNRALFCVDLDRGEALAALCFHIDADRQAPVLLRDLAVVEVDDAGLAGRGRLAAHLLLAYLAEVGAADGRGRRVAVIAGPGPDVEELRRYGFREAPRPSAFGRGGTYMEMAPPPRLPSPGRAAGR